MLALKINTAVPAMSEWSENKNQPSGNIRMLLQQKIDKTNSRGKLADKEATCPTELEAIARNSGVEKTCKTVS